MDDSEPDLYGGLGGHVDQDDNMPQASLDLKPVPMFVFHSEADLMTSNVFQQALGKALASKDRYIHALRVEILELHEKLAKLQK
jgi:hypothetical protein